MAEPAAKKAKIDNEAAAEKKEHAKELETDASTDNRPKIKQQVAILSQDTTMNLLPSTFGNILTTLSDGGFQYLLAGARANVGVSSGRYMFEAKILEHMNPTSESGHGAQPTPKHCLRIGFSTASSPLVMSEFEDGSVFFESDGDFVVNKARTTLGIECRFTRDQVIAVVLNLDASSPNSNTVSLFRDGERVCQPQQLPESFKGKALFPTLSFRNVTLHANFGAMSSSAPLPFKCKMLQEAASKDVTITNPVPAPKDGKFEVLFPVCLPDEGTFMWLDSFLEKNPSYVELSDRSIWAWAQKSGIARPKGYDTESMSCKDKPEIGIGLPSMDDMSVRKLLQLIASLQPHHYVVMEVKANLVKDERKDLVSRFWGSHFKRIAFVVMGEPPLDFRKKSQELILADKQVASDEEFKKKLAEDKKKKDAEKKQKEAEKARKKAEREMRKKQKEEEKKKKEEEEVKEKEDTAAAGATEEKKEEGKKDEALAEEKAAEDDEEEEEEEKKDEEMPEADPEPPKVTLSTQEKKEWFYKGGVVDISAFTLNMFFTKFTLPEKDEGFDEIRYEWQKSLKCAEYLKTWTQERKLTTRVEDIIPGDWFQARWKDWQKVLPAWHTKQNEYKAALSKKEAEKAAKASAKAAKKAEADKKAAAKAEAQKAVDEAAKAVEAAEDEEKKAAAEAQKKVAEEKLAAFGESTVVVEEEEEVKEEPAINFDKIEVFGVEDVLNLGGTPPEPLFSRFGFEDWQMMSLRFELNLLAHSFRRDVSDPDRIGIHVDHLTFYYQKYFKKALNVRFYGVEHIKELLALIRDTIVVAKNQVVVPQLPEDLEAQNIYVMLTEEARRDRNRKIDLGDESARLKVTQGGAAALLAGQQARAAAAVAQGGVTLPGQVRPLMSPNPAAMQRPQQSVWQQQQQQQWRGQPGMGGMGGGMGPMGGMGPYGPQSWAGKQGGSFPGKGGFMPAWRAFGPGR